ncbi:MAG: MdtA/MuxA family multidrug efflux RND transporter periplasmic adaptor subunit [Sterolibacterium sp.]|jgi:multidrug efflux system membrane fusion protein|nr:MdtA/MuxA family multidrug efflux RND transporter periplasmic adaptor subunit [Sterolibacterium sp.]
MKIFSKQGLFGLLLVGALASGGFYFLSAQHVAPENTPERGGRKADGGGRPLPVQAAMVRQGDMEITISALGTVTARNTAIVKARVAGQLARIVFQEGQRVRAAELLAEIDPRPYQAQFDQAAGQLARDEALLANARADLARYQDLLKQDSIARQQVDNQAWLVKQYEGTVSNDHGVLEAARLQLGFTRITAPFDGRVGLRQVDVGNYVQTSDSNGVVMMTQTQPINVVFSIPADQLTRVREHLHAGQTLRVEAFDAANVERLASGKLSSIDNQVDLSTGTLRLKALFANADERLFPNQFVNVRLSVDTQPAALLAPSAAIQRGNNGSFVYVVGADGKVAARPVSLGAAAHDQVAIVQGLAAGERVVIDGADKLRDGAPVEVTSPGAGKTASTAAAKGEGRVGAGGHVPRVQSGQRGQHEQQAQAMPSGKTP